MEDQAQQSCPRVALSSLTRSEFEAEYLAPNLPVLLTGATDGWRAAKEWVQWPLESPAVARLAELFGHHSVTVHGARSGSCEMTVAQYATWWAQRSTSGNDIEWRYLKDWHLAALEPEYRAYDTPACLGEDWLNEFWAAQKNKVGEAADPLVESGGGDHRFVYVGPKGSTTALHADVLFSYSWSANVVGSKRWLLVPAENRHLVSDAATKPLKPHLSMILAGAESTGASRQQRSTASGSGIEAAQGSSSSSRSRSSSSSMSSRQSKRMRTDGGSGDGAGGNGDGAGSSGDDGSASETRASLRPLCVVQRAGELLFVPSGWYHEVENLEDCISINHNVRRSIAA